MLHYGIIDVSERIDVNKISVWKECDICQYCCFLIYSFKFQPTVCSRCHNLSMMSINLSDIAVLNIQASDYHSVISLISKSKAINLKK